MIFRYKHIALLFLVIFSGIKTNAQFSYPDLSRDTSLQLSVKGTACIASSNLNNDFFNKFIWGGYIDNNEKKYALADLQDKNMIGGDFEYGISFILPSKKINDTNNFRFGFSFNQVNHFDAKFSKQLANLLLNGNESTRGTQVSLGSNNFNLLSFNTLKFHAFSKSYYREATHTIGFGLGIANGISNTSLKLYNADLYTQENGEYLDISYSGLLNNTNSIGSKNPLDYRGHGTCLDIFYQIEKKSGYTYTLFVENAGIIKWKSNATSYSNDTSFRFEGIDIQNISTFSKSFSSEFVDSLVNSYYPKKTSSSYTTVLPIRLLFSVKKKLSSKVNTSIIFRKQLYSNYEPRVDAELEYLANKNLSLTITSGYGGYCSYWFKNDKNKLSAGLNIEYKIKDKFFISVGSPYLNYLNYSGWLSGMGAFFNLKLWI